MLLFFLLLAVKVAGFSSSLSEFFISQKWIIVLATRWPCPSSVSYKLGSVSFNDQSQYHGVSTSGIYEVSLHLIGT